MSAQRVAVVTGGNKGIGFAIVKSLCQQLSGNDWKVYLTARDEGRGQAAVEELKKQGCSPNFCQLDIDDQQSIEKAKIYFSNEHGGIDILVNNAGMAYKNSSTAPFSEQAEVTVKTNYFGTLNVCNAFKPLLRPKARLVIVSSMAAPAALVRCRADLKDRFTSNDITMDELSELMNKFVSGAKDGVHEKEGWPNSAYSISKMATTAMAMIFQRDFDSDAREDLVANACCPGYVDTDMTSHKGHLTIEQGAENPVYLALLPPKTDIRGKMVMKKAVIPWE